MDQLRQSEGRLERRLDAAHPGASEERIHVDETTFPIYGVSGATGQV